MYLNISDIRRINTQLLQDENKLDRYGLEKLTGIAYAQLGHIIGKNPKKNIGDNLARTIEKSFKKPENWLDYDHRLEGKIPSHGLLVDGWDSNTPLEADEIEIIFYENLAFACGDGSEGIGMADEKGRLRVPRSTLESRGIYRDKTFGAVAEGSSMSPTINDGDTILVDTNRTSIKDGYVFAISYGGLHLCKRLYRLPNGGVRMVSDNSDEFKEEILTAEQQEGMEFQVVGWVYSVSSLYRW